MIHFTEINQAPSPYSILQHIGKNSSTKACAQKLSQILKNNIDNRRRRFGLKI